MLHDVQGRWYGCPFAASMTTLLTDREALIAATVLHWITVPDPSNRGYEDDMPQALGIGFEKSTVHTSVSTRTVAPDSPGELDPKHIL